MNLVAEMYRDWYHPYVLYVVKKYKMEIEEAQDIVSLQFYKLLQPKMVFENIKHIKSYMFVILNNDCRSRIPQLNRITNKIPEDQCENLFYDTVRLENYRLLYEAQSTLPTCSREVIIMLFWGGLSTKEVATIMGTAVSTVKNQKARGLELLREKLGTTKEKMKENKLSLVNKILKSTTTIGATARRYGVSREVVSQKIRRYAEVAKV